MSDMTQAADEIRALVAGLYDDPEDFLKRPHLWFGGRSPNELLETDAGQFVLLKLLRGRSHMPLTETDRDFKPYTAANTDPLVDQAISQLESYVEKLRLLKGSGPEIAQVFDEANDMWGDNAVTWLIRHNRVLGSTPIDLMLEGRTDEVRRLLVQIAHGISA
jgi:uncharacterized protein (DUF2384 family)